jgi:poly(hydroxyalkanoate) depolymerase family esterase
MPALRYDTHCLTASTISPFPMAPKAFMKHHSSSQASAFTAASITETIERALATAGLDTKSSPMRTVTENIRRALSSAGMSSAARSPDTDASVIDVVARVVGIPQEEGRGEPRRKPPPAEPKAPGEFVTCEFSNGAGTRAYKLYVPARTSDSPMPLVVMLHGCTQSADDFAAGTQMNRLADGHGFMVAYPEQAADANVSKCWNWFKAQDQVRGGGEPSLIAGIAGDVVERNGADPRRIFVAGLSAGAAMAVILGETYPELFAGVGAHSGLPYGSAHDIPSAMTAMKGGRRASLPGAATPARKKAVNAVPIIVFHGDRDHTVKQTNGAAIIQQAKDAHAAEAGERALRSSIQHGTAPGGRSYSRTVHADASGQPRIESWTLHGGGHAWSGGNSSGSYTDGTGPDASAEMVRFFLAQPRAGSA